MSGEHSWPSSLGTECKLLEENLHFLAFPHNMAEENFMEMDSVSSCAVQDGVRLPSVLFCL
jgi:hypothetical protein